MSEPELAAPVLPDLPPVSTPQQLRDYAWKTEISEQLQRNRIPERYRYEVKEWPEPKQLAVGKDVNKILKGNGAIVALVGPRGLGKTVLSIQIVIKRIWRWKDTNMGYRPYPWMPYRKLSDLMGRYKPLYADFGSIGMDELESARKALVGAPLLIIDEVGDYDDSKIRQRLLSDLLDRRYSALTDTLLISNQEPEAFAASVGQSVVSRISECGAIIPCNWPSFRTDLKEQARHA
jgi:DNA replication protein DnaC